MDTRKAALAFIRETIKAERLTVPGQANIIVVSLAFLGTLATGFGDVIQVLVRIWNPDYETGLPSFVALFAMFIGGGLLCVVILGLLLPGLRVPPPDDSGEE